MLVHLQAWTTSASEVRLPGNGQPTQLFLQLSS